MLTRKGITSTSIVAAVLVRVRTVCQSTLTVTLADWHKAKWSDNSNAAHIDPVRQIT